MSKYKTQLQDPLVEIDVILHRLLYRPCEAVWRGIGIARRVRRPNLEIMTTDCETGVGQRTRARRKRSTVQLARKRAIRLIRRKRKRRAGASCNRPRISRDVRVGCC